MKSLERLVALVCTRSSARTGSKAPAWHAVSLGLAPRCAGPGRVWPNSAPSRDGCGLRPRRGREDRPPPPWPAASTRPAGGDGLGLLATLERVAWPAPAV